jgi:hypothetical protein
MKKKQLAITSLFLVFLVSCGGSTVSFVSSPMGATIVFDGKKAETPAEFTDIKPGTYNVEGKAIGYLPGKMTVVVDKSSQNQFSMVFKKEVDQSVSFNTSIPMDGIRFRAVKEPKRYEFTPYDPATGQVAKTIIINGPTEPLFDIKLVRDAAKMPNANVFVKATTDGYACWSDCQAGSDAVCPMDLEPKQSKPNWDYLPLVKTQVEEIKPEIADGKQIIPMFKGNVDPFETDYKFNAVQVGPNTVWSYVDKMGRQKLLFNNEKNSTVLWQGEYGIGANDYFLDTATIATICDTYIFTVLTTDQGYMLSVMDFNGKVVLQKQIFEFARNIKVKKFGKNIYGILLTGKNDRVKTITFDNQKFIETPTMVNADFNNTTGIWIPMGSNFELRITENLSVMIAPVKGSSNKYMVIYAGSRN